MRHRRGIRDYWRNSWPSAIHADAAATSFNGDGGVNEHVHLDGNAAADAFHGDGDAAVRGYGGIHGNVAEAACHRDGDADADGYAREPSATAAHSRFASGHGDVNGDAETPQAGRRTVLIVRCWSSAFRVGLRRVADTA